MFTCEQPKAAVTEQPQKWAPGVRKRRA